MAVRGRYRDGGKTQRHLQENTALRTEHDHNPQSQVFMKLMVVIQFEICYGVSNCSGPEVQSRVSHI